MKTFILSLLHLLAMYAATIIPTPVLGGAMIAMFGMVIAQGIKMLSPVIGASVENAMIVACSVGMGMGMTAVPELFQNFPSGVRNGIVAGSITAIALNIIFNMTQVRRHNQTTSVNQKSA